MLGILKKNSYILLFTWNIDLVCSFGGHEWLVFERK
jgi:hypothetical protein